jgi:hypothetical protein
MEWKYMRDEGVQENLQAVKKNEESGKGWRMIGEEG